MMKWERFRSIPVLMVFLAMGFVYYVTLFVFVGDWVGLQSSAGSLNVIIFTFLIGFCIFSFFVCVLTDPGHVPSSFVPDVEDGDVSDHQESSKRNVLPRKCETCSTYKPRRCHHCRVCRRCILRMDHHCIWINNCVGYWNYKAFFVLVLFATIGSMYSTVIIFMSSLQKNWQFVNPGLIKLTYVICGAPVVGLTLTLSTLLGWHIYLLSQNMTTIEYYEGVRGAWLARKSGQSYRHPFDLGFYKNVTSVLGPNMLKWLWPTAVGHLKDGVSFRITRDSSQ